MFEAVQRLTLENKLNEAVKVLGDLLHKHEKSQRRVALILTLRIYCNIQLNATQAVVSDLNLINSPYDEKWRYETYPEKYGDRRGTMCPFSLFLMHAYYPLLTGASYTALDRLYAILKDLEKEMEESACTSQDTPHKLHPDVTVSRLLATGLLITDVLLSQERPKEALEILNSINLRHTPNDSASLAMLATIYNQLGSSDDAVEIMAKAIENGGALHAYYRGLSFIFSGDYQGAIKHFNESNSVISSLSTSSGIGSLVLDNNIAVSLAYAACDSHIDEIVNYSRKLTPGSKSHRNVLWNVTILKELFS